MLRIFTRVGRRLRALVRGRAMDRELDEELRFHLEMETEYNRRHGMSPEEARVAALREFGGVERAREGSRDARGVRWADDLTRDLRVAARAFAHSPAFALVAVLTFALAIGATTAVFSVVDAVLLRPLPFQEPARLVQIRERNPNGRTASVADPNVADMRGARTIAGLAAYSAWPVAVAGGDEPVRALVAAVTPNFFGVLGAAPLIGRGFAVSEGTPGGAHVAVVSERFWHSTLHRDPDIARRTLRIGHDVYQVVGVTAGSFNFPGGTDVWVPATPDGTSRTAHNWDVVARLAPGVSAGAAQAELDAILGRLKAENGTAMDAVGASVTPLQAALAKKSRTQLLVLMGAVVFVLLVACVNLASAAQARAEARGREFAVRAALGAGRGRLARQLVTESLLLALVGGALGAALAWALTRALPSLAENALPAFAQVQLDMRVLGFAMLMTALSGVLVGLLPAWRVSRTLGGVERGGRADVRGGMGSRALVGAQCALALMLLAGAGLLTKSLFALLGTDPGFHGESVLTARIELPGAMRGDTTAVAQSITRMREAVASIPGVRGVGVINVAPLSEGGMNSGFMVDGSEQIGGDANYRVVDTGYFSALDIPLVRGRGFGAEDRSGSPHAVLINETAAQRFWPGVDPIGHRVRFPGMDMHAREWLTIVGIVRAVRTESLDSLPVPELYVPYAQRPERLADGAVMVVRASTAPAALAPTVRARLRSAEPDAPVELRTMETLIADSVGPRRFAAVLLASFAALALGLAALGIYGVLAYAVARRQREIGVRMALGAARRGVRLMVLRDAMGAVIPGLAVGLLGATFLTRLLRGMLYEVSATDPVVLGGVTVLLALVAVAASLVPANRATRVDPMVAMRGE